MNGPDRANDPALHQSLTKQELATPAPAPDPSLIQMLGGVQQSMEDCVNEWVIWQAAIVNAESAAITEELAQQDYENCVNS